MKNLFLIILCFLIPTISIDAQNDDLEDKADSFLDAHYEGGAKAFLELIYTNIKFPEEARSNCISGVSIMTIRFGQQGEIVGIQQRNPLGGGLQTELSRVIRLTVRDWKKNFEDTSFTFSIAFMIGERDKLDAYIRVIAYGLPQYEACPTTKYFEKKLKRTLEKKKYENAKVYCEELLQRHPFSETYLKQYEMIIEKLGL
jgi:hypothetical protein